MPDSRLTDVNTACITYRTKCLMALDKKQYKNCIGAIKAMNSLLPEDTDKKTYRLVFDTDKYNELKNSSFKIECPVCNELQEYDSVQFDKINMPLSEQIVSGKKTTTVWFCKCGIMNRLDESNVIENATQIPFYSRYVPFPPINDHGLLSQLKFHTDMVDWIWICLDNLEASLTMFRDDNWNKGDKDIDDVTIDTSIEEKEIQV